MELQSALKQKEQQEQQPANPATAVTAWSILSCTRNTDCIFYALFTLC